jgi:hypothetical protein
MCEQGNVQSAKGEFLKALRFRLQTSLAVPGCCLSAVGRVCLSCDFSPSTQASFHGSLLMSRLFRESRVPSMPFHISLRLSYRDCCPEHLNPLYDAPLHAALPSIPSSFASSFCIVPYTVHLFTPQLRSCLYVSPAQQPTPQISLPYPLSDFP